MSNLLILGDGFLGKGIFNYLSKNKNVTIIKRKKLVNLIKSEIKFLDLLKKKNTKIIINCIGNTKKDLDFNSYVNPNIKIPILILNIIKKKKITFINFASQDEDKVEKYFQSKEITISNKLNYAVSKNICTKLLQNNYNNNFIMNLKIPIIYGEYSPVHMLYGEAEQCHKLNKQFKINNPHYLNNFISVRDLSNIIEILIDKNLFKKKYFYADISNNKPEKVINFIKKHFPYLKIILPKKYIGKFQNNKTHTTTNKIIINYFK